MQGVISMSKIYYHIPPKEGWKVHSYYVVEVSTSPGNPIFEAILYTGFLDNTKSYPREFLDNTKSYPRGYSGIFNPSMKPEFVSMKTFEYIKAIRKIDMVIPNINKQMTELNLFELKTHEEIRK